MCNRRDAERLEKVAAMIDSAMENGKISKTEAGWLQGIVNEARATEWEKAMLMSRQLLSDQSDL